MNTIERLDQLYTQLAEAAGIASDELVKTKAQQWAALAGSILHDLQGDREALKHCRDARLTEVLSIIDDVIRDLEFDRGD